MLPRALKIASTTVMFDLEYAQLAMVRRLVKAHAGEILDEDVNIRFTARFISDRLPDFELELTEFSRGNIHPEVHEIKPDAIFPI